MRPLISSRANVWGLAGWLALTGCSFLGLDNLPVSECTRDTDCNGLERLEPPESDCRTWQCNPSSRHCELATLDADGDGVSAMLSPSMMMCTAPGEAIDCSDSAADRFPGNPEACDGVDNDCDGLLDQGAVGTETNDRPFTTVTGSALSAVVADGGGLDGTELLAAFVVTAMPRNQVVLSGRDGIERAVPVMVGPTPTAPNRLIALAPVGQRWAMLYLPGGSCDRLALTAFAGSATGIDVEPTMHTDGLPTTAGAPCNTASRGTLTPNPGADRHVLVTYAEVADACGTANSAPVYALDATIPASGAPTFGTTPIVLGETSDWVAPSVVGLGSGIYLVAYPKTSGAIEVRRVDAGAGTSSILYEEPAASGRAGVSLGYDGETGLVLSWSTGCGTTASEARFLTINAGRTALTAAAQVVLEEPSDHISATYQPVNDEWLLFSSGVLGWTGQRLDNEGSSIGASFVVRTDATDAVPTVSALASGAAFEIFGAAASSITRPPGATTLDTVGCLPGS